MIGERHFRRQAGGSSSQAQTLTDIVQEITNDAIDRLATGAPASEHWDADWIYVADAGVRGHWEPTASGLPGEWSARGS